VVPFGAGASAAAFTDNATLVWAAVAMWAVLIDVLDWAVKAVVTELVEPAGRSVGFGWLALARELGLLVSGVVLGLVYDQSITLVATLVVAVNAVALIATRWVLGQL
jgi:hypothetical protein